MGKFKGTFINTFLKNEETHFYYPKNEKGEERISLAGTQGGSALSAAGQQTETHRCRGEREGRCFSGSLIS